MSEQSEFHPPRRRRTWLRLVLVSVVLVAATVLACSYWFQDPNRARAINLYESLRPHMTRSEVWAAIESNSDDTHTAYKTGYCTIAGRYNLTYSFDDDGKLAHKVLLESADQPSRLPNWIAEPLRRLGVTGLVHRSWP